MNFLLHFPRSTLDQRLSTPVSHKSTTVQLAKYQHTPLAQAVQNGPVLGEQLSLHDLKLQSSLLCCVVNAVDRKFVSAERAGIVPRVVTRDGRCSRTAPINFTDTIKVWIAVASKAVIDPFGGREAIVVLSGAQNQNTNTRRILLTLR